jgi:hypothetical protein
MNLTNRIKIAISVGMMSCCVPIAAQATPIDDPTAAKAIGIKACSKFYSVSTNLQDWQIVPNGNGDLWFVLGKERAIVVRRDGKPPDGRICKVRVVNP